MQDGTVKWFNASKGYGFIRPFNGSKDVFVHITTLEKSGLRKLNEGQKVCFDTIQNHGKETAENIEIS